MFATMLVVKNSKIFAEAFLEEFRNLLEVKENTPQILYSLSRK